MGEARIKKEEEARAAEEAVTPGLCPFMSRLVPQQTLGGLSVGMAAVPCAGEGCALFCESEEIHFEPGKESEVKSTGSCAFHKMGMNLIGGL